LQSLKKLKYFYNAKLLSLNKYSKIKNMKKVNIISFVFAAIIITACSTTKKAPSTVGKQEPGNNELLAIQSQYKDATLAQLQEGHTLYTAGACIKCHGAGNIYKHETAQWKGIIDEMANKAHLTAEQKDAVYKYVLAIKATQPK
jgi:mono/diheme cytochrome c family protein